MFAQTLDGQMSLFSDRVLPFDIDVAQLYAELAVTAKVAGRGFPTPDGYIAAIAASRGFIVASRDTVRYEAASITVISQWEHKGVQQNMSMNEFRRLTALRAQSQRWRQ